MAPTAERTAPVQAQHRHERQLAFPSRVPWSMHERAWSAYAAAGHGSQSAERLAERGGFGVLEFVACIRGYGYDCDYSKITDEDVAAVAREAEGWSALVRERNELRVESGAATERAERAEREVAAMNEPFHGGALHHIDALTRNLKETIARESDLAEANDALVARSDEALGALAAYKNAVDRLLAAAVDDFAPAFGCEATTIDPASWAAFAVASATPSTLATAYTARVRAEALREAADKIAQTYPTTNAVHDRNDVGRACMLLRSLADEAAKGEP